LATDFAFLPQLLPDRQMTNDIYILHAFQKKSPKGVKTSKQDIDLIKKRYQQAVEKSQEERK